jgi:hypothetical protein
MKRWLKIVLAVWALMFITDILTAFIIKRPIFCLPFWGGEWVGYYGLGYKIEFYYDFAGNVSAPHINPLCYLLINGIIATYIAVKKFRKTKKQQN